MPRYFSIQLRAREYAKQLNRQLAWCYARDQPLHPADRELAPAALDKKRKHDIEIVIDRLVIKGDPDELSTRLADSLETALGLTDGLAFADNADSGDRTVFSANFACPESGFTID